MKVSVVIPCYNMGAYVNDAVESVYGQSFKDYELIIVDDGSTDLVTHLELKRIQKQYPEIKIFYKKNSGLAGARNYGVERAKGVYITCLDADDMLADKYLEKTVSVFEEDQNGKIGFVTTWLQEFGERKNLWETSGFDIPKLLVNNVVHAGSLFRKEVWEKIGGYQKMDIGGYEDWNFWLSIVEKNYEWTVIKKPLFYYRIRENSMLADSSIVHVDIYKMLHDLHRNLFDAYSKELVMENAKELKTLHDIIKEKDKSITELEAYKDEVLELRTQVFKLRDEIHTLRNSRVFGKIIKVRESVGDVRHKIRRLPRTGLHKVRVVVAPFVPGPARRALKRVYKKGTARLNSPKPATTQLVENKKWDNGIPLVSVVIPYYNRADTIDETLYSLDSQTYRDFETIIVDDGSNDLVSVKKIEELKKARHGFNIIQQKNSGVASARNNGINRAQGKYIICLDSDDILEPTFIEKCTILLEVTPDISLTTSHKNMFGVINERYENAPYSSLELSRNNMVITAAEFKKEAWEASGGYKSGIGYEDWEYWINLAEHGFWGKLIPETLFRYRTSMQSRYVEDKDAHWRTIKDIRNLHPKYKKHILLLLAKKREVKHIVDPRTGFKNLNQQDAYQQQSNDKPNILVAVPWMTFGGAETLIVNFCNEIKDNFNLSFVTGLQSEHEWEYKFKEISERIYHLTNLFDEKSLYVEFISNYIMTRDIQILHIIHTSFMTGMLPELKKRHPNLKIIFTVFNDRAEHFNNSISEQQFINAYSTDNSAVANHYKRELEKDKVATVIPNGINSSDVFNPAMLNRGQHRSALGLEENDLAVFFIGRLSEEKNPDVFLHAANTVTKGNNQNVKFFVIGDGGMRPEVEKQVADINHPNVQYLGYQSEIAKYLVAADIFVLPSSVEGFPLSILEAMAMRVAVISSDVGAVSEVVESGVDGFVVTPGSAEEIVKTIVNLRKDQKLLESVKLKARQKIDQKYSNKLLGQNYTKLYKDILK